MDATTLRLVAHVLTIGLLLAVIGALILARGKRLNMSSWRLLCSVLALYACWFFLLSISLRDLGILKRAEMVWLLGTLEFSGAVTGWWWLTVTMRLSFRLKMHREVRVIDSLPVL